MRHNYLDQIFHNMNRTGRYIYDSIRKQVVKISGTPEVDSALGRESCWFPKTGKYYDTMAARTFHSKTEKRAWMQAKGIREIESDWHNPLKGLAESRDRGKKVHVVL